MTPGAKVREASPPEREAKDLAPKWQNDRLVVTKQVGGEIVVAATSPGAWSRRWQKTSVRGPKRKNCEKSPQKMKQQPRIQIVAAERSSPTGGAKQKVEGDVGACSKRRCVWVKIQG